jgi:hypothetical protein
MFTTKPRHNPALDVYDVLEVKLKIRDRLITKGLQLTDANAVVEKASILIDPSVLKNYSVLEAILDEYALTISRLRKYTLDNNLPHTLFLNMAHGVALAISKQ